MMNKKINAKNILLLFLASILILSAITGLLVGINTDKILSPRNTFRTYLEGIQERDLMKVAYTLYDEYSQEYWALLSQGGAYFDNLSSDTVLQTVSYVYKKNWTNMRAAEAQIDCVLKSGEKRTLKVYFKMIRDRWLLTSDIYENTTLPINRNGDATGSINTGNNNNNNNGGGQDLVNPVYPDKDNPNSNNRLRLSDKSITSYTVPDGAYVDDDTFYGCANLSEVTLPANYIAVRASWFVSCNNLASVTFAENATNFKSEDGVVYTADGNTLVYYPIGKIQSVNSENGVFSIPNTVNRIAGYAFYRTRGVHTVVLSESVRHIDANAFASARNLSVISLNSGLETIGNEAFFDCFSLTSITIPNSVTHIGNDAFRNNPSLLNVVFEKDSSLEFLGYGAFQEAEKLESVSLPDKLEILNRWTFEGCSKLQSVTLPSSLKEIKEFAFRFCQNLSVIEIPKSVNVIKRGAFDGILTPSGNTLTVTLNTDAIPVGFETGWAPQSANIILSN